MQTPSVTCFTGVPPQPPLVGAPPDRHSGQSVASSHSGGSTIKPGRPKSLTGKCSRWGRRQPGKERNPTLRPQRFNFDPCEPPRLILDVRPRNICRGQGGPFPANHEDFPQHALNFLPEPHGQRALRGTETGSSGLGELALAAEARFAGEDRPVKFGEAGPCKDSLKNCGSHCVSPRPLGFRARKSARRAFGSTSDSFSTPRASRTALRLAAIHRR